MNNPIRFIDPDGMDANDTDPTGMDAMMDRMNSEGDLLTQGNMEGYENAKFQNWANEQQAAQDTTGGGSGGSGSNPDNSNPKLINGNFVAVVDAPEGAHGFGHIALMVGNDHTGWSFLSKEGRQEDPSSNSNNNPITGGPALPYRFGYFKTLADFFKDKNYKEYINAAIFIVSKAQANNAIKKMAKEANSCLQ